MQQNILSDITVIDMTEGVAGPYAAMVLSDMGANVIKVERPAGDWSRPADHFNVDGELNAQFISLNRNKRDIGLDVASEGGKRVLARMIGQADVLISNYRPGVMGKLGFGYEACSAIRPDLIYCTISGFGQEGAYAQNPASDTIIQAMSGLMSLVGEADGPPTRVGFPMIDMAAANYAVQGILLSLYGRQNGHGGANLDISLMAAALGLMSAGYTRYRASGVVPLRQGNENKTLAPAGAYRGGDGRYFTIAILRDEHWQKLCVALDLRDMAANADLATNKQRVERRAEIDAVIAPLFATEPAAYWLGRLGAADILCGPINTYEDIANDPNLAAQLPLVDGMAPNVREAMGVPIRRNGEYNATYRPAPAKGQHTAEVLAEFSYSEGEVQDLLAAGSAFLIKS
jgi:crotonobetainyl-CoA:carnitine CoA-transferase CaiB-like acyl-CoA transferase